ncbi:FAD-NAD(P)-binding protein [Cereibacter sphaeroides]|uniref:FAD-NAD(P)-binding protein n=1 Tax=Cereibacter sphaeroides TaxID=1063 RepID=UPI0039906733
MARVAIVGTGPTGIYTFFNLIKADPAHHITLFERGKKAGIGLPYSPEAASKSMLANIASIEIPPIDATYLDWLKGQPDAKLSAYGLDRAELDDRQFTPRLLLGEYFRDQLLSLLDRHRARTEVLEDTEVTDVIARDDAFLLRAADREFGPFDRVILATGHVFPDADEATRSYFPSPWSGLIQAEVPPVSVGIMGTSLSSIDAAMAVANQHGRFRRHGEELTFQPATEGLHLTLMSWSGVLPEADFWCPIPYEPLQVMTDDAVARCAAQADPLDRVFALLQEEIAQADPAYADRIGLATLTADTFGDAYFAAREAQDPFRWARRNLEEVEHNKAHQITVPWRYALLRMHEKVETLVPHLGDEDRKRFDGGLKKVFVDNYAAVPSESIRRLLALRDAGLLSVLALGEDYELKREPDCTVIRAKGKTHVFPVFIDARGQKPMESEDMPFPSLRRALIGSEQDIPELDEDFALVGVPGYDRHAHLAAIPYLMHDRPFVQGITASAEIGAAIARGISAAVGAETPRAAGAPDRAGGMASTAHSTEEQRAAHRDFAWISRS